jgi:thiol-disulfide isomerase/thioredoxin
VALVGGLALSACGGTTFYVNNLGDKTPVTATGWKKVDPFEIDLPTDRPIGDAADPDLTGPLLLNIWGSFCDPCKAELPMLQKLATDGTLTVAGFTRDHDEDKAVGALKAAAVTYPNWMDTDAELALALHHQVPINQVPSSVLVRNGLVVAVHIGEFKSRQDVLDGLVLK